MTTSRNRSTRRRWGLVALAAIAFGIAIMVAVVGGSWGTAHARSVAGDAATLSPAPPDPTGGTTGTGDVGTDGDDEDEGDEDIPVTPAGPESNPAPTIADSTLQHSPNAIPTGKAPLDTLGFRPAARGTGLRPPPPAQHKTPLGLTPIVFFALFAVGHVFLVRAVTD